MMQFENAAAYIHDFLKTRLSPSLLYHSYSHTIDVYKAAIRIAEEEGIKNNNELMLLKTAALFHDCGYAFVYQNHEEEGCRFAREVLPAFDYIEDDINLICEMIMCTKLPSNPKTTLQKILCDADLDYLGSDEFKKLGNLLYAELHSIGKITSITEWDHKQISFLENHKYYTHSVIALRESKKKQNLDELKSKMNFT